MEKKQNIPYFIPSISILGWSKGKVITGEGTATTRTKIYKGRIQYLLYLLYIMKT